MLRSILSAAVLAFVLIAPHPVFAGDLAAPAADPPPPARHGEPAPAGPPPAARAPSAARGDAIVLIGFGCG
jgi:hypothetical protein